MIYQMHMQELLNMNDCAVKKEFLEKYWYSEWQHYWNDSAIYFTCYLDNTDIEWGTTSECDQLYYFNVFECCQIAKTYQPKCCMNDSTFLLDITKQLMVWWKLQND